MAAKSMCGKEYEPFTWLVERGKMRELVLAIGDNNPIYLDRQSAKEAGYQDTPASSTYITLPGMWMKVIGRVAKDSNIKLHRMLHGEQNYEYFQEIYAGDVLTGRANIVAVESKSGKAGDIDIVRVQITYTNQRNELVMRVTSILVERLE
jgi:acyl dehydratase